ncbi:MAG: hypothetical protein LBL46_01410 [Rickettsiales bacterium]|jgi:hypothetical protein|nr:hypothetical protein [Rickettsiales bacterium]
MNNNDNVFDICVAAFGIYCSQLQSLAAVFASFCSGLYLLTKVYYMIKNKGAAAAAK